MSTEQDITELSNKIGGKWLIEGAPDDAIPDDVMLPIAARRLIDEEMVLDGVPGAKPRHLRDHLDGARGAGDHRQQPRPQLHRPRRVPAHGRDRAALHPHARQPLQRPRRDDRRPHPGLLGGDHARGAVTEVEVAPAPRGRGQADRQAEPRLRRRRPRRLGEVLPLLRRRAADRAAAARQVHDRPRGRRAARRREHDRRRRRARDHVHRPQRRHHRHQRSPRGLKNDKGLDVPLHIDGASGGFVWPFLYPDSDGTSGSSRCARSTSPGTSSASSTRDRLADLPREGGPGRGPRLLRELPRQDRRHLHAQLLHRLRDGAGAVLQPDPLRAHRLQVRDGGDAVEREAARRRDHEDRPRSR